MFFDSNDDGQINAFPLNETGNSRFRQGDYELLIYLLDGPENTIPPASLIEARGF